jgi:hypothetical protein
VKIPLFNFLSLPFKFSARQWFFNFKIFLIFNFYKIWEVAYGGKQICWFHRRGLSHLKNYVLNEMSI